MDPLLLTRSLKFDNLLFDSTGIDIIRPCRNKRFQYQLQQLIGESIYLFAHRYIISVQSTAW